MSSSALPTQMPVHSPRSSTSGGMEGRGAFIPRFWDTIRYSIPKLPRFGLNGEEGEVLDNEARPIDGASTTARDIVVRLPRRLSIRLFSFLDLDSVIACRAVSRRWRVYAEDNAIWRDLFYRRTEWRLDPSCARSSAATTRRVSLTPATPPELAPLSFDWRHLYKSRTQLEKRWHQGKPKLTRISGHSDRSVPHSASFSSLLTLRQSILSRVRFQTDNYWLTRQDRQGLVIGDWETVGFLQPPH